VLNAIAMAVFLLNTVTALIFRPASSSKTRST
jgi:hypothetical protein